jgi:GNAT superfamily N-acetyltransferase
MIEPGEWPVWRELRLRALADAPEAFASTLEEEESHPDGWWQDIVGSTVRHPRGGLWIAEEAGEAAGMVFSRLSPSRDTVRLGAMWVDPRYRRRGAGGALVASVAAWARANGAARMDLWVAEDNRSARRLYERAGFTPTSRTQPLREGSPSTVRLFSADL